MIRQEDMVAIKSTFKLDNHVLLIPNLTNTLTIEFPSPHNTRIKIGLPNTVSLMDLLLIELTKTNNFKSREHWTWSQYKIQFYYTTQLLKM